ncbi:MAG: UbiA family prenyltransferase [Candidatus Micrarchaeota archaeon]
MAFGAWLRLSRIEHSFMVAAAVVASQAVSAKSASIAFNPASFAALFPALGPFFITAGSFVLNDWFGVRTDAANRRRERPLVSREIARADALKAAVVLYALGLLFAFYAGTVAFAVAFVYALLSVAYDPVLKKLPLAGNLFIASSMSVSFLYGNLAVSPALAPLVALFCAISFLAGAGRELLITLRDVKGDRKIGATTLPMLIGARSTVALANSLFAWAVVLSWIPVFQGAHPAYLLFTLANNALVLCVMLSVSRRQNPAALKKARNLTLAALVLGIAAFASLAL